MDLSIFAQAIISGLLMGGIYALIGVGLTLVAGVMNIINFAHGDLIMIGMFLTYWLNTLYGVDPYISLFIMVPIFFLVGVAIQKFLITPILSAPDTSQLFLTIGLSLVLQNLALMLWKSNFRTVITPYSGSAIVLGEAFISTPRLASFIAAAGLTVVFYVFMARTRIGRAIRATAQSREVASLVGVNVHRTYMIAMGIGAVCAGTAGALLVTFYVLSPTVGTDLGLIAFLAIMLGGMGSFTGALVGGLIIGLAQSLGTIYVGMGYSELITLALFILILLFKPQGIFSKNKG
jgi:branched-chain amino acid transport system permease protein